MAKIESQMLQFDVEGLEGIQKILNTSLDTVINEAIFDISAFFENKATENIKTRIYDKPESKNYRRTGRALGGRKNEAIDKFSRIVRNDTRIKGAEKNYAPMLNKNPKIKKLNTRFWDDAVDAVEKEALGILRDKITQTIKNRKSKN